MTSATALPIHNANQRSPRRRFPLWARAALVVLVLVLVGVAAFMAYMSYIPADMNTATTRASENELFTGSYQSQLEPIAINQIHSWTFHVESAAGETLENAAITVDGGMPQHGHGLPTAPQVTAYLGDGNYRVDGMKFNMPGWWVITFDITVDGQTDRVTFNLVLE